MTGSAAAWAATYGIATVISKYSALLSQLLVVVWMNLFCGIEENQIRFEAKKLIDSFKSRTSDFRSDC